MRVLVQRVKRASVAIVGASGSPGGGEAAREVCGSIDRGLLAFVGVAIGDEEADLRFCVRKLLSLRIFQANSATPAANGASDKMNLNVADVGGGLLLVSQFTLCADVHRGARPSFTPAMPPVPAAEMFAAFVAACRSALPAHLPLATGRFGADMQVELVNDGPVTLWLDSRADSVRAERVQAEAVQP